MSKFTTAVKAFIADEDGLTAIEYGLMAAVIGSALVGGAALMGTHLGDAFDQIGSYVLTKAPKA